MMRRTGSALSTICKAVLGLTLAACNGSDPGVVADANGFDGNVLDADQREASTLDGQASDASHADAPPSDADTYDARLDDAGIDASDLPTAARGVYAASAAQDFVDSVGVNTHIGYTDRNYWDFTQLARTLSELGIRHIRDGQPSAANHLNPQSTAGIVTQRLQALGDAGVKATLISGYALDPTQGDAFARDQLAVFKHLGSTIDAFEHTNEPDLFAARDDDAWEAHLRAYLPALWQVRNADAATTWLPVLAPSVTFAFQAFAESFPTQRDHVTHCNVHPYPGGQPPESNVLRSLGACRSFVGEVPVMATETGYHTAIHDTSGHPGVSETAQGIYMPRLFLEYFLQGYARTHSYELLDEYADPLDNQREAQFGLVRLDWSPKPAFVALQRLLSLLRDEGPPVAANGIALRVSDRNVRVVLLQKRDRTFWIALWRPISVYDLEAKQDIATTPTPVTLSFEAIPTHLVQHTLTDLEPGVEITPSATTLTLDVGATVTLLEVEGLPVHTPLPTLIDHLDDLSMVSSSSGVNIDHNTARAHDFDNGLAQAAINGAHLTYQVDGLHDFAVRAYRFCQGCIHEPLDAIGFLRSDDGVSFVAVAHAVVDRRPSMDAREVVTLVAAEPLPESTRFLRIVMGTAAPRLGRVILLR